MSLNTFKQILLLKPCSSNKNIPTTQSQSQSKSSSTTQFETTRKPPKSSLSQQLSRFLDHDHDHDDVLSLTQTSQKKQDSVEKPAENDGLKRPASGGVSFGCNGPYEPFVLSGDRNSPVVQVPASINCRLLEHQREGVKFLYNLYKNGHGGVLGDDMGLGKTIQAIAFLSAVYGKDEHRELVIPMQSQEERKGPVLIICPSSVIENWESEFSKWATFTVSIYHGVNRDLIFDKVKARAVEIVITSFDTYRIHGGILSEIEWEIVIVDEAHRLKNEKSKLYAACLEIGTRKRYGLSGTVMQNKIMELFNLFDWVVPGCLGSREHFREYYDEPLKHGQRSTAPERFVRVAEQRKQHLVEVLSKYFLRRTKEETIGHLMMGKEDNVVFCAMSDVQKRVYRRLLQLPDVQCLINKELPCSCGSPLKQVECCKRTVPDGYIWPYLHRDNPDGCDSCPFCIVLPCLVKLQQISNHLELIKPNSRDDPEKQKRDAEFASAVFGTDIDLVGGNTQNESFMELSDVRHCGKMRVLENLLSTWISHGDKILLFSYSVRMLDILEKFLIRKSYSFSRLDGSTPTGLRQSLVNDFNSSPSKQVFLISTRAGGLGLNLVSANRVVIFDPNWNPAHDLQAQDRSFRFGQKRHVVVFRFLSAGSLEELVYTRQIYKQQLSNIATSGKMEKRYFEGVQDCKEFQGELFGICNLFRDLSDKLFTSEIIQSQEKEGKEHKHISSEEPSLSDEELVNSTSSEDLSLSDLGMCFLPAQARSIFSVASEKIEPIPETPIIEGLGETGVAEELGIVYAHRNEDVVNLGPSQKQNKITSVSQHDAFPNKHFWLNGTKKSVASSVKEKDLSWMRKKSEYRLLAKSLGMEVVEFSRWFLSSTDGERKKVYRDYKKRKLKFCHT